MAFTVDNSTDFSTATGYTTSNVTISGGAAAITGSFTGTATVETPAIDTSTWESANSVEITATLAVGFDMRFLVSFDGGTVWMRYREGLWVETDESDIATLGMTINAIRDVRDWSRLDEDLNFLVAMTRATSSPVGSISQISVNYIASGDYPEPLLPAGEPSVTGNLEDDLGIQPEFGQSMESEWPSSRFRSFGNYEIDVAQSTSSRRKIDVVWRGLTSEERDAVVDFLRTYLTAAFVWESAPLTDGSMAFWCASEPVWRQHDGVGLFEVRAKLLQRLGD